MAQIIILNGPPGCGKDTLANWLWNNCYVDEVKSFKEPMFEIAKVVLGSRFDNFMALYNDRQTKEQPIEWLNGKSPREFLIFISEDFVKPCTSKMQFGILVAEGMPVSEECVVMSDGGFPDEVLALADHEVDGRKHTIHLVRLHRHGFDFSKDSRDHIHFSPGPDNVHQYDITLSNGQIESDAMRIANETGLIE
ncbi:putative kinase [Erwinia phage Snitter]|nr:putative kinase [Erwinia phage Snitter]